MIEIPHFAFPFGRGPDGKHVRVVEQDSLEHVDSCCQVIIRCPTGHRVERPEFGWPVPAPGQTFPLDTSGIVTAIQRLEPRVTRARAQEYADVASDAVRHMSIDAETG